MRSVSLKVFYILYFVLNLFSSFWLLEGVNNPNITNYSNVPILALIGDFGVLLLFFYFSLLFKSEKKRVNFLLVISFIFTLLIVFLEVYANIFTLFFSYEHLISFKNPSQGDLIVGYFLYVLGMFSNINIILPLLLFLSLFILHFFIKYNNSIVNRKKHFCLLVGVINGLIPILLCNINIKDSYNSINMNAMYGCNKMGVYNYYLYSVSNLFNKEYIDEEALNNYLNNNKYIDKSNIKVKDKNLIIIQLEAINNFVIDLKIDDEYITPYLSSLKNDGYYNSSFISVAGIGNTSDAEFSSLTGLYPNGNDLSIFEIEGENYPSIAKEFNEINYKTLSIHGNEEEFYNRGNQHVNLFGFNEHIDKKDLLNRNSNLSLINNWIGDLDLLKESINIYKEIDSNFFSYNILVTSHAPYTYKEGIDHYFNPTLTKLANDYISYVKYVDYSIGMFIEELKKSNLYNDSIIMLYGDHTSSLLKKDVKSITNKDYSDISFRREMCTVPFIVLGEEIPNYIDNRVHSNVDVFPTIASLFNLSPKYSFGESMFSDIATYCYSPRSLDIYFDNFSIESTSKRIEYYSDIELKKEEIDILVNDFNRYKYFNDLILKNDIFKN